MIPRDVIGVSIMHTDYTLPGARWRNQLTNISAKFPIVVQRAGIDQFCTSTYV